MSRYLFILFILLALTSCQGSEQRPNVDIVQPPAASPTVTIDNPPQESGTPAPTPDPEPPPDQIPPQDPIPGPGGSSDGCPEGYVGDPCHAPLPEENWGTTYYVRLDGGTASECTGLSDAAYPGSGSDQPCAWKHPFIALPPGGAALIASGDRLIIADGAYQMGLGAPGAQTCNSAWPYACTMLSPPSGIDSAHPTRIYGASWASGCATRPELFGVERSRIIIDLSNRNNIRLSCLEITDHSQCIEFHGGPNPTSLTCERDTFPYGDWASQGIFATDSSNVELLDLDIHGMASTGIHAGRIADWTLDRVKLRNNGWVGWDGDVDGADSNSGTITMRHLAVEWNGCSEDDLGNPIGCWGQEFSGYGDGIGTGSTGGNWIIEDSKIAHNTQDGIDLLYHNLGGDIIIDRVIAEGNAGNQIKVRGNTVIRNTIAKGDCSFFEGKSYSLLQPGDHCRALGNTISFSLMRDSKIAIINSTIRGEGDCLMLASSCAADLSGAESITARNSIFLGDTDFRQIWENSCLFYADACGATALDSDNDIIFGVKDQPSICPIGGSDICSDPLLGALDDLDGATPGTGSPTLDAGLPVNTPVLNMLGLIPLDRLFIPPVDLIGSTRAASGAIDIGAIEVQ